MKKEEIEHRLSKVNECIKGHEQHGITELWDEYKELKQERKQLKQQLKDLPKFEIGRWYKDYCNISRQTVYACCVLPEDNGMLGYGFTYAGDWESNELWLANNNDSLPATDKEVEEALIKEAKKRGFNYENYAYHGEGELKGNLYGWSKYSDAVDIFINNKWAEIIQPKTVELNGNYTEVQLKDILNSQF